MANWSYHNLFDDTLVVDGLVKRGKPDKYVGVELARQLFVVWVKRLEPKNLKETL